MPTVATERPHIAESSSWRDEHDNENDVIKLLFGTNVNIVICILQSLGKCYRLRVLDVAANELRIFPTEVSLLEFRKLWPMLSSTLKVVNEECWNFIHILFGCTWSYFEVSSSQFAGLPLKELYCEEILCCTTYRFILYRKRKCCRWRSGKSAY